MTVLMGLSTNETAVGLLKGGGMGGADLVSVMGLAEERGCNARFEGVLVALRFSFCVERMAGEGTLMMMLLLLSLCERHRMDFQYKRIR